MTVTYKKLRIEHPLLGSRNDITESSATITDAYGESLAKNYGASKSNRDSVINVTANTGYTDLTGDTYDSAVRGRLIIGTTQANASLMGVIGCVDVGASKNIQGNVFGLDGVLDFYGACTAGSGASFYAGAGRFTVWNEGTTTVGAGGVLCGVDVCQNSGKPTLGSGAVNPAVHIRSQSTKQWQFGLYMLGTAVTEAIRIGAQANTDGSGVPLSSSATAAVRVHTDTNSTDIAGAVDVRGGLFRHLIGTTQTNSSQNALRGQMVIATGKNIASGNYHAVRGYLEIKGTTSITGAATYAGAVCAYVEHGGTTTIDSGLNLSGVDIYQVGSPTATGDNAAILVRADATASNWKHAMKGNADNGIYLTCVNDGVVVSSSTLSATAGRVGKFSGTIAAPNLGDGYGAVEVDVTFTGTYAGISAALSAWVNVTGTGAVGSYIVAAQNNGIYADSGANTGSTVIFGMRAQGILTDAPTVFAPFSINTSNRAITGLFHMGANPDVGYLANAGTSGGKVGDVPLFCDSAGQQYFVRIYSARG